MNLRDAVADAVYRAIIEGSGTLPEEWVKAAKDYESVKEVVGFENRWHSSHSWRRYLVILGYER